MLMRNLMKALHFVQNFQCLDPDETPVHNKLATSKFKQNEKAMYTLVHSYKFKNCAIILDD